MATAEDWFRQAGERFRQRDFPGAEALCRQALEADPGHAQARVLHGKVLAAQGEHAAAAEAYTEALAATPDDPELLTALGWALYHTFRYEEALRTFEAAVANGGGALPHQGIALVYLRRFEYARSRDHFRAAIEADPDDAGAVMTLLYTACYDPDLAPEALRDLHAEWGNRLLARSHAPPPPPFPHRPDPDRVLRVGYLSPDFRDHPVAKFIGPVIAYHHPRAVAAYCYAHVPKPDEVTQAFQKVCPHWRDVTRMDDRAVADLIRRDRIDILVELAGYTENTRITVLAHRPAPVQVSYLGYPATTGLDVVDWRLTDAIANPPGTEVGFTERLARIGGTFSCYMPPAGSPEPGPLPALANGHVTFGSTMNTLKITPQVVALWSRVLHAVPGARMLVARQNLKAPELQAQYRDLFVANGVAPERVTLASGRPERSVDFLDVYRGMDVTLDTFPYNGHTTTCESLWMGVPVITLAGRSFIDRVGATVLTAAGLPELVADTEDAYVARAAELAADPERLAALRAGLRSRLLGSRLLDSEAGARALEAAYRDIWRDWCATRAGA